MDLQYVVMTKDGFIPAMDEWLALDIAFGDVEMDHATVNAYLDELRSMGANESRKLGGVNFLRSGRHAECFANKPGHDRFLRRRNRNLVPARLCGQSDPARHPRQLRRRRLRRTTDWQTGCGFLPDVP